MIAKEEVVDLNAQPAFRPRLRVLIFLVVLLPSIGLAQTLTPIVGGLPVRCTDAVGVPVFTIFSPAVPDAAQSTILPTGVRVIVLNPMVVGGMPPLLQLFVYAHECGHHLSGDVVMGAYYNHQNPMREQNADRIGIRILRDQLHISQAQANAIAAVFQNNPAIPPFYLPGPLRAQWISDCYKTQDQSCGSSGANYANPSGVNSDEDLGGAKGSVEQHSSASHGNDADRNSVHRCRIHCSNTYLRCDDDCRSPGGVDVSQCFDDCKKRMDDCKGSCTD